MAVSEGEQAVWAVPPLPEGRAEAVTRVLLICIIVLTALHVVMSVVVGDGELGWWARRLDMNGEYGFPAGFSATVLGLGGLTCLRLRRLHDEVYDGDSWRWLLVGAAMVYAAFDEAFVIHELAIGVPSEWFDLPDFLRLDWVVLFIPPLIVLAAILLPWFLRLPRWLALRMVLSGVIFVTGSVVLETVSGQFTRSPVTFRLFSTMEELLEMAGASLFLVSVVRHQDHLRQLVRR